MASCISFIIFLTLSALPVFASRPELLEKYDHDVHNMKVFNARKIDCTQCHTMRSEPNSKKLKMTDVSEKKAFHSGFAQMCHECHKSNLPENKATPQNCFLCHSSKANLNAIKPRDHDNIAWKKAHATEARGAGASCLNCHTTSQCVKCHTQRNDVELRAHTRNFRFVHSVEARLQPQRCDTCHSKSYCMECHMRKR